jgi:hypothetical protein
MRNDSQPRSVQVHPSDNVAIVVNEGGLPAGIRFESGLIVRETIPEAHKIALRTIPEGAPIIRYGVTIGYARTEIPAGSWVHEGLLTLPEAPALDKLPIREVSGRRPLHWRDSPLKAISTTTVRLGPKIFLASALQCNVSRLLLNTR